MAVAVVVAVAVDTRTRSKHSFVAYMVWAGAVKDGTIVSGSCVGDLVRITADLVSVDVEPSPALAIVRLAGGLGVELALEDVARVHFTEESRAATVVGGWESGLQLECLVLVFVAIPDNDVAATCKQKKDDQISIRLELTGAGADRFLYACKQQNPDWGKYKVQGWGSGTGGPTKMPPSISKHNLSKVLIAGS